MELQLKPGTSWSEVWARCRAVAPEAFGQDRAYNLVGGEWRPVGTPGEHLTPVDGTPIPGASAIEAEEAERAVQFAAHELEWLRNRYQHQNRHLR